ncbi:indolepyruvate ferredoxin oxidoreductase family protein [Pseudahrensia aquimaris]|uniref:Indolepyruvate ferredoxin oxidoreductase family protein n=1 Tax=Pseudahrensia aquimaris TaxID=744461 RepID=A0ABW3FD02_9HYPH
MAKSDSTKSTGTNVQKALADVRLADRYDLSKDSVFLTGTQAVVRLTLMQKERDRQAGLNTGGYVSGYRGSPIGGLDMAMWKEEATLKANDIVFEPGLNEDLAATALWGTQQAEMRGEGKHDGVFGVWYGKGPGVDRSGDVLRHANLAGTSKNGGVLALMGDDHTAESSTTAHQSEFHLLDIMIPILSPAGVQEILDYGVFGYGLSRYAGVWVGIKCVKDTIESTAVVDGRVDRVKLVEPEPDKRSKGGLNIRPNDPILAQEARLHEEKRDAILDYVAANKINKTVLSGGKKPRVGVITAGKSYLDVRQALDDLGLDEVSANNLGLRLYKCGCVWPLSRAELRSFAKDLDTIIVVEEKRALIEVQVREELYDTRFRPTVVGKKDENGEWLFPVKGSLDSNQIAIAIGERLSKVSRSKKLKDALTRLKDAQETLKKTQSVAQRVPYFCAGCPHNSSTHVPEGSRAYAGIGCHYMVQWMDRETEGYTQMGGEGANWVGEHHFSKRDHVFQNLGDGTYNHSGYLAIRAAAASKANITYKILFNDAVAMTGGQPNEGGLTPWQIANQVAAEGAKRVVVVTDEPEKYSSTISWPLGTTIHHRSELNAVQKELAATPGLTAMIYDQTCASEKRRRRKRGLFPDPDKRVVINEMVCEGCGDCGVKSNCVAVGAVETEFGRKRQIDQSSCNKDFSCINGFCPSFVTVHGGKLKTGASAPGLKAPLPELPEPTLPALEGSYGIIVTGVGGTGVVTVGAVMGMAAHLEGKGSAIIDMAGLAQKGGEVASHLRIAPTPDDIKSIRIAASGADLILGCDMVTASTQKVLGSIEQGRTRVVVNAHEKLSGEFTHNVDFSFPTQRILKTLDKAAGQGNCSVVEAEKIATALMGDAIASNMFMLGYAWQQGTVPISRDAILKAIELNGVQIPMNQTAFEWGRVAAHDLDLVPTADPKTSPVLPHREISQSLEEMVERRVVQLRAYQNASYAKRFEDRVAAVRAAEEAVGGKGRLAETVARNLYKLMAIKDEYEVARLYADGGFEEQLKSQFESWDSLEFHLAPPLFSKRNDKGELIKKPYGPWMMKAYRLLSRMRVLRGSVLDVFGYTEERKMERRLLADYETVLDEILDGLDKKSLAAAVALADYPQLIRGFGHVKEGNVEKTEHERRRLRAAFKNVDDGGMLQAAE